MTSQRIGRTFTIVATIVIVALVTGACGRRVEESNSDAIDVASSEGPGVTVASTAPPALVASPASSQSPNPGDSPDPSASPSPSSSVAPLVAPDLTAIQQLLDDIDAALGADSSATNDEGSPQ